MSEHTPGPWLMEHDCPGNELRARYTQPDQSFVASVFVHNRPDLQLIAAAPDLLEAVLEARWWIGHEIDADQLIALKNQFSDALHKAGIEDIHSYSHQNGASHD